MCIRDRVHLQKIRDKLEHGNLCDILDLGEIAAKYLQPDRLGVEFQVHDSLEKLARRSEEIMQRQQDFLAKVAEGERSDRKELINQYQQELLTLKVELSQVQQKYSDGIAQLRGDLSQIRERLIGTGIGPVGEVLTIKELKAAFPTDYFADSQATRGGADIVAEVKDAGSSVGKIVVSVKYQGKWSGEFVAQLRKNLKQENAEFGILVSKTFPGDALSDKAYLTPEGCAVVKPEYCTIAYLGMRQAAIHLQRARLLMREEEDRLRMQERVTMAIRDWLSGDGFHKAVEDLELATQASKDTDILIQQWQNYAEERSSQVQKTQQKLRAYLIACSSLLNDLQSRLGKPQSVESFEESPNRELST